MPSFAVDVLLGVILIGGVYILFGRSAQTSAKSSSKKKKRSKASKSKAASTAADGSQQDVKNVAKASPKPSFPSSKPEGLAPAKQTSKDGRSSTTGQGIGQRTRDANDGKLVPAENGTSGPSDSDDVEFPSLSSSYAARASQGTSSNGKNPAKSQPKPLAERRAKTLPKTAVDDMVEKDDALQGEQKFSRTMRIVKPQADKPLLLDDEGDSWSDGHREARQDSAWQSVPVSSRSRCRTTVTLQHILHTAEAAPLLHVYYHEITYLPVSLPTLVTAVKQSHQRYACPHLIQFNHQIKS